jgi:hypothetical protein
MKVLYYLNYLNTIVGLCITKMHVATTIPAKKTKKEVFIEKLSIAKVLEGQSFEGTAIGLGMDTHDDN